MENTAKDLAAAKSPSPTNSNASAAAVPRTEGGISEGGDAKSKRPYSCESLSIGSTGIDGFLTCKRKHIEGKTF